MAFGPQQNKVKSVLPESWGLICIANLLIVATLGLLMRYKIVYSLPWLNQAFTLHAHENFVFTGWVSLTLFCSIITFILDPDKINTRLYRGLFYALLFSAYGALISFFFGGYNPYSIAFTGLIFIFSIFLIAKIWKDLTQSGAPKQIRIFVKGAMAWYILSLPGSLMLASFNIFKYGDPIVIRSSLYYFLHFQYNGWFTFCIFALLLDWLYKLGQAIPAKVIKRVFILLTIGLIPGYFLSILAFYPNWWVEAPAILSVATYLMAAAILIKIIYRIRPYLYQKITGIPRVLWIIATVTFFTKTLMQAGTLVPSIAAFTFAFRPLVIAFLHLTFLCFVSFFLIGYLIFHKKLFVSHSQISAKGLILFIVSVLVMELALFLHSLFVYFGSYPLYYNKIVFWSTVGTFAGLLLFFISQFFKIKPQGKFLSN